MGYPLVRFCHYPSLYKDLLLAQQLCFEQACGVRYCLWPEVVSLFTEQGTTPAIILFTPTELEDS